MWKGEKKTKQHQYDTLISSNTTLTGDIHFSGGLHIDGKIEGSVTADPGGDAVVRVSNHGLVRGEVKAPNVIINGQVQGDVHSSSHVELAANAVVTGTVYYNLIEMVMGAQVNGSLMHQSPATVPGSAAVEEQASGLPDASTE